MDSNATNSQASQASQEMQNNRKRHNEKALKIRQRQKEQGQTIKEIISYINNFFYDHDETGYYIKRFEDIDIKYIKRILKYMCRDSLYLEQYKYKIRSDDIEDLRELKRILIEKNKNIKNKSKFDIYDLKNSMKYLTEIFNINYLLNENMKETIIKMLFIYLDDDNEKFFNINLETGENDDEKEYEQDLFLILVNFICPYDNIENTTNNNNIENTTNNNKLSNNLYVANFKPSLNDPEYKYKIDEYNNKYFIIFEVINKVSKNIYDVYIYKINYIVNRSFGTVSSNRCLYNFNLDDVKKEKINNFYINTYKKLSDESYDLFTDGEFFYYNDNFDILTYLTDNTDPILYFKYLLTSQNKNDYEKIYNLSIEYRNRILHLNKNMADENIANENKHFLLKFYKNRLIGDFNTIEILKDEGTVDGRMVDTFYYWSYINKHNQIIDIIDMLIFLYDSLKNDKDNIVYQKSLLEYQTKFIILIYDI